MRMTPAWSLESPPRRRPDAAPEAPAQEEVGDQRDHADEDADQRGEADVVVADVRHLVGEHALELLAVEHLHQPARDGDGGVLRVAAGGEGVGRRVLDDVDRRHVGRPAAMVISSTTLKSCGSSSCVTWWAPLTASTILSPE